MSDYDYSIHYERFHDDTEAHADATAARLMGMLGPHLPSDKSVPIVDIGCGYGFALRALRNLGYTNLSGVEVSPQQADRCRRAGFDVTVTDDTAGFLRARPGQHGAAVLLDVLEHVPTGVQIDFLRAIHASLAPGGNLILTVPNANSILAPRWRYIDHTHFSSFTEHSLHFVLRNAGFDRIWMDNYKGPGPFPRRFWKGATLRRWLVRFFWLQVYRAELPWENLDGICFELNLRATATKAAA